MARRQRTSPLLEGLFASGTGLPFGPNGRGSLRILEGPDYIREQVLGAIRPGESDNPFQSDLTIGDGAIFQNPDDPAWRRTFRETVEANFRHLERANLARLVDVTFSRDQEAARKTGDYYVTITYLNLETNTQGEVGVDASLDTNVDLSATPVPHINNPLGN